MIKKKLSQIETAFFEDLSDINLESVQQSKLWLIKDIFK